jgi:hypothetical protein
MNTSTRAWRIAFALLVGLCGAHTAAAQPRQNPREDARIHVGPLYLTPTVQLREFGLDTNVFNSSADPQSDFTFTAGPQVDLWVPVGRRALLKTSGGADLVYFQKYGTERSVNPHAQVRGEVYLQRLTLFAENDVLHTRQRPNFEIDVRARRLENTIRAGAELRLSTKFSVEVAGRQSVVKFDGDAFFAGSYLEQSLNRDTRGVAASFRYQRTPLTAIVLRTEAARDRFSFSPLRDADTLRIQPGVEFRPPALIAGSAYLGLRRLTARHDALPDFRGMAGSARLRFRLPGATAVEFAGDRDLGYSYEPLQPYFVVDGYGATVRRRIVGRFDASLGGQRQRYSYRDLVLPNRTGIQPERQDLTLVYTMSIGYTLNRDMRVGLGVSRMNRTSNTNRFAAYEGFRVGTSVTYGL